MRTNSASAGLTTAGSPENDFGKASAMKKCAVARHAVHCGTIGQRAVAGQKYSISKNPAQMNCTTAIATKNAMIVVDDFRRFTRAKSTPNAALATERLMVARRYDGSSIALKDCTGSIRKSAQKTHCAGDRLKDAQVNPIY
jgi:hypothetical protein